MKTGDITDAFLRALLPSGGGGAPAGAPPKAPSPPSVPETPARAPSAPLRADAAPVFSREKGRPFLSEYHIRKALTPGSRDLTIAKDAIVSPLALEWLALQGVRIVRSS